MNIDAIVRSTCHFCAEADYYLDAMLEAIQVGDEDGAAGLCRMACWRLRRGGVR